MSFVSVNKLASMALLLTIVPVSLISLSDEQATATMNSNLKLTLDSPSVLTIDSKIPNIVIGESSVDKETRVKAEQAAQAVKERADEEAKKLAEKRNTISREYRKYSDPSNFDQIYLDAASTYGVDAKILKAIHIVETGASGSTSRSSYAGATGPMQFLPSTWKRNGVDGNGDGIADITNVVDAIHAAARYLKVCGYPDVKKALWGYNPSTSYYNKVMNIAQNLSL